MTFIRYFGYFVIAVYIGGLLWLSSLPSQYTVERTVVVDAPREYVFNLVADLKQWDNWSPWEELDIQTKKKYEGMPKHVGYRYHWEGNDEIGSGSIQIMEVIPDEYLSFKVEFKEPFASKSQNIWRLEESDKATVVTWKDTGKLPFFLRGLSGMLEERIGDSFEYGLTNIKSLAEEAYQNASVSLEPDPSDLDH